MNSSRSIVSRRVGGPDTLANLRLLCPNHDNQIKEGPQGGRRGRGRLVVKGCYRRETRSPSRLIFRRSFPSAGWSLREWLACILRIPLDPPLAVSSSAGRPTNVG